MNSNIPVIIDLLSSIVVILGYITIDMILINIILYLYKAIKRYFKKIN